MRQGGLVPKGHNSGVFWTRAARGSKRRSAKKEPLGILDTGLKQEGDTPELLEMRYKVEKFKVLAQVLFAFFWAALFFIIVIGYPIKWFLQSIGVI
jgi:hypothetical protein